MISWLDWVEGLGEIITGVAILAGIAYGVFKYFYRTRKIKYTREMIDADFKDLADKVTDLYTESLQKSNGYIIEGHTVLNTLTAKTRCRRAILLSAHNNGGAMSMFCPRYGTALDESVNGVDPLLKDWQMQVLDVSYTKMLDELLIHRSLEIHTRELPDGILRDLYESMNIGLSMVYVVDYDISKHRLIYLSLNFPHNTSLIFDERQVITSCLTRLKALSASQKKHSLRVENIKKTIVQLHAKSANLAYLQQMQDDFEEMDSD